MILAIVQARMGSSRLPGKEMEKIESVPMIGLLLERLKRAKKIDQIVLATTTEPEDDRMTVFVESLGIPVFRGSKADVVDRFYQCARKFNAKHVGRVTGDCPLIDPQVVDDAIKSYLSSGVDYLSNDYLTTTFPDGLDFEIFSIEVLKETWAKSNSKRDREHVCPYILRTDKFSKKNFPCSKNLSRHRWTVDQPQDLEKVRLIYKGLYRNKNDFNMWDVLKYLQEHPEIEAMNRDISRNEGYLISLKEDSDEVR